MPRTILIYTDENVHGAVIRGLRQRGINVLTAPEAKMRGKVDQEQLEYAKTQGRVLLTHDSDFFVVAGLIPDHAGIIYTNRQADIGKVVLGVTQIWESVEAEDIINQFRVL